ncbi:HD domain-containing protein [Domibacillus tundrae]|uniref:HD domain-containing protein n=1 Tax=Domibacillus tundrae TaxID=1587527 RepID=UPI0006183449|nr:ATP-binding protein [Domibacillus tundrae]
MSRVNDLPNSIIIKELESKLENSHFEIDFLGILNSLKRTVSQEISYINLLFPEYTPHDEKYHIKNLFNIADKLLDEKVIKNLSVVELFVLAASLYGHDWGMAVSSGEREFIRSLSSMKNKENSLDADRDSYFLIDDEKMFFIEFCQKNNLKRAEDGSVTVPDEFWREYVRETHALRSGKRVLAFISKENQALASAVQKACEGHWADFSEIRNSDKYPEYYSVLNESINLRALAIYVRLIDLLDLTADRTPYILWKFVSPKNSYSKMEWKKHRALHGLSFAPYTSGSRYVQVTGGTTEHDVYAALQDLSNWVDSQLKGCKDVMAEFHNNKYVLNVSHIKWSVTAQGFHPIPIKIEFNRDKMLDILSEEIYDKDAHVFLRELLQNSVDAIRMRRELLKSKGLVQDKFGEIHVNVEKDTEGNMTITWRDNGIGMDEHIVKNYLAVAGNSYYSSKDFENSGLKIDPISKFGVGILSCNTVSDYIEIQTKRDPYIGTGENTSLKISIPSFKLYFRVELIKDPSVDVGTIIKVFIDKMKTVNNKLVSEILNVTEYLSYVAGFVDIPIFVTENGNKTAIVHPLHKTKNLEEIMRSETTVKKLGLNYEWASAILPQDLEIAKEYLEETTLDIEKDLGIKGYEGTVSFLRPKNIDNTIYSFNESIAFSNHDEERISIRYRSRENAKKILSPSLQYSPYISVYRDGILLSNVGKRNPYNEDMFIPVKITVNIPKNEFSKINIARSNIVGENSNWEKTILGALIEYVLKKNLEEKNIINLANDIAYLNIKPESIPTEILYNNFSVPFLCKNGQTIFKKLTEIEETEELYQIPETNSEFSGWFLSTETSQKKNPYNNWQGVNSFIGTNDYFTFATSSIFHSLSRIVMNIIKEYFYCQKIQFVEGPFKSQVPLFQEIWSRKPEDAKDFDFEKTLVEVAQGNELEDYKYNLLIKEIKKITYNNKGIIEIRNLPDFVTFKGKFKDYFGYSSTKINIGHPKGKKLIRILANIILQALTNDISAAGRGSLEDAFSKTFSYFENKNALNKTISNYSRLFEKLIEIKIISPEEMKELLLDKEDFIPSSFEMHRYEYKKIEDFNDLEWGFILE